MRAEVADRATALLHADGCEKTGCHAARVLRWCYGNQPSYRIVAVTLFGGHTVAGNYPFKRTDSERDSLVEVSVAQAAARLGVDRSRVQRMLRDGTLAGRRLGRDWLVDGTAVAQLAENPHRGGRPMAPARAWGLLDLLDGGTAPWLSSVARSQVREQLRLLAGGDARRWRDALRRRSNRIPVRVHPAALSRIGTGSDHPVLWAGAARAAAAGADLVVLDAVAEIYVKGEDWPDLAKTWHARSAAADANLLVRLPVGVWPFDGRSEVGPAVLAADLLESFEPRAVAAGLGLLNTLIPRSEPQ